MALPLRLLWGLRVTPRQKGALAGIFLLGFIIIIFAVVRVVETSASIHHVDPVWLALWSMIEASVGTRPFFRSQSRWLPMLSYVQKQPQFHEELC